VASFFLECTADNVRWRQTMRRKLEMALDPHEWHNLSKLALSYGIGLPAKLAPPPPPQRAGIHFIHYRTQRAILSGSDDPMEPQTTAMLKARAQEDALLALEAGGREDPEVIIAARAAGEAIKPPEAEDTLESVLPGPADPSATRDMDGPPEFRPLERDRPARGEW
jgi:hypothetical protein